MMLNGCPMKVSRRMTSQDIIEVLCGLFVAHGVPSHIRSDNGPEFIAKALREWLERSSAGPLYIQPGSPWENGYAESFHSKVRDEFLGGEVCESLTMATKLGASWRRQYNEVRPQKSRVGHLKATPPEVNSVPAELSLDIGNGPGIRLILTVLLDHRIIYPHTIRLRSHRGIHRVTEPAINE